MNRTEVDGKQLLEVAAFLARHPNLTIKDLEKAVKGQQIPPRDVAWLVRSGVLTRHQARQALGMQQRHPAVACGKALWRLGKWSWPRAIQLWQQYGRPAFDRHVRRRQWLRK